MKLRKVLSYLFCASLLSFSCSAYASISERVYAVKESQLQALESRLQRLDAINLQSVKDWQIQQEKLKKLEEKSLSLEKKLQMQKVESEKQEALLKNAEESFKIYEKETSSKIRREKTQKIIWMTVAGALLYAYISK